jgi:hypothetical protein
MHLCSVCPQYICMLAFAVKLQEQSSLETGLQFDSNGIVGTSHKVVLP